MKCCFRLYAVLVCVVVAGCGGDPQARYADEPQGQPPGNAAAMEPVASDSQTSSERETGDSAIQQPGSGDSAAGTQ